MTNSDVVSAFEQLASLMEILGQDSFRVNAHRKAARAIDALVIDVIALARSPQAKEELRAIDGLGPKTADKVIELATTGRVKELEELSAKVPPGLLPLLSLQGLGPKTVRMLWQEAGVVDAASLKKIIDDGSITQFPRMGGKAAERLKAALEMASEANVRLHAGKARIIADRVIAQLKELEGVVRIEAAGSLRRGAETVGDIDILIATSKPELATTTFCTLPEVRRVLTQGATRSSVRIATKAQTRYEQSDADQAETQADDSGSTVQVDLRVVPIEQWGAALAYFTGSKAHNVILRQLALNKGLTLNEYGLFPNDISTDVPPHQRGITPLASKTEAEVHHALGLVFIEPELREGRGETDLREEPALLRVQDICAELHAHTTASDGVLTIVQLATEAKRRGFHTIAITDHSQSSALAGGLKPTRLREHIRAIAHARQEVAGITILAGSEVDILADGRLDYDDELLAQLDVVVASPHAALTQDSQSATERLIRAVCHPLVHILGHPTGRLILRRKGIEPDISAVIAAAKAHDTALEINSHWMRLDLRDVHARAAILAGVKLAVNCDVHHPADFDNLGFGVMTARRAWATPQDVVNTWTASKLHAWLKCKRP